MDDIAPTPWRLITRCSGIGAGFNDYFGYVADANGKEIAAFVDRATMITRYGNGVLREQLRWYGPTFEEGDPYPHTATARLLAAAPALLVIVESVAGENDRARRLVAEIRGDQVPA